VANGGVGSSFSAAARPCILFSQEDVPAVTRLGVTCGVALARPLGRGNHGYRLVIWMRQHAGSDLVTR